MIQFLFLGKFQVLPFVAFLTIGHPFVLNSAQQSAIENMFAENLQKYLCLACLRDPFLNFNDKVMDAYVLLMVFYCSIATSYFICYSLFQSPLQLNELISH